MKKILITGGAGYKGSLLAGELLKKNIHVTILDNFMYGYDSVLGYVGNKNCTILKKDIRNLHANDVKDYDIIFHLAGISGYPACEANPHSAEIINVHCTKKLTGFLAPQQLLVYASTPSFYGKSGEIKDESSIPEPVS